MSKVSRSNGDSVSSAFSGVLTAHEASKITADSRSSRVSKLVLSFMTGVSQAIKSAAEDGASSIIVSVPNDIVAPVEAYLLRNGYTVQGGADFYWGRTRNCRSDSLLTIKWKCYDKDKI